MRAKNPDHPSVPPRVAPDPRVAQAHALFEKGMHAEAAAICRQILAAQPNDPRSHNLLGVIGLRASDFTGAAAHFQQALRHDAKNGRYWSNLAIAWREGGDIDNALRAAQRCVESSPKSGAALVLLGELLFRKNRIREAAACLYRAYPLAPNAATAYTLGSLLRQLQRHREAIDWFNKTLAHDPRHANAFLSLAASLADLGQFRDAKEVCERSLAFGNASSKLYCNLGMAEAGMLRPDGAVAAYRKALALDPADRITVSNMANSIAHLCEWNDAKTYQDAAVELTRRAMDADEPFCMMPFTALTLDLDPEIQRRITAHHVHVKTPDAASYVAGTGPRKDVIVIGYLSSDFRDHPVMHLARNLFRHHDRQRFRVIGYSSGPDDGSDYRRHVEQTCDRFVDIRTLNAQQAAEQMGADGVDILVDMTGHTAQNRLDVLARRPAPVQIHFLGYPGTMATPAIDYFVTDHFLSPHGAEAHFAEKLIYMPDTYQISDDEQRPAENPVSRSDEGLPDDAFVFCSFNSSYKIEPVIFDRWMEILRRTPGSVLWLLTGQDIVTRNLREAAQARGVAPSRLVFAQRAGKAAHLARTTLADLFLDTWIVCGHTTVNDALQMALPVVACPRPNFISRVSGTLLRALWPARTRLREPRRIRRTGDRTGG